MAGLCDPLTSRKLEGVLLRERYIRATLLTLPEPTRTDFFVGVPINPLLGRGFGRLSLKLFA